MYLGVLVYHINHETIHKMLNFPHSPKKAGLARETKILLALKPAEGNTMQGGSNTNTMQVQGQRGQYHAVS